MQCVKEFEEINDNILAEELRHQAVAESEDRLNFGLLEVVYEWACNKVCFFLSFPQYYYINMKMFKF